MLYEFKQLMPRRRLALRSVVYKRIIPLGSRIPGPDRNLYPKRTRTAKRDQTVGTKYANVSHCNVPYNRVLSVKYDCERFTVPAKPARTLKNAQKKTFSSDTQNQYDWERPRVHIPFIWLSNDSAHCVEIKYFHHSHKFSYNGCDNIFLKNELSMNQLSDSVSQTLSVLEIFE